MRGFRLPLLVPFVLLLFALFGPRNVLASADLGSSCILSMLDGSACGPRFFLGLCCGTRLFVPSDKWSVFGMLDCVSTSAPCVCFRAGVCLVLRGSRLGMACSTSSYDDAQPNPCLCLAHCRQCSVLSTGLLFLPCRVFALGNDHLNVGQWHWW